MSERATRVTHQIIDGKIESSFLVRAQEIILTLHRKTTCQAPRVNAFMVCCFVISSYGNHWEELPDDGLHQVERCNNQGVVLQVC